jgi:hypothetical protein
MKPECKICGLGGGSHNRDKTHATGSLRRNQFLIPHELAILISGGPRELIAFCSRCGLDFDSAYTKELIDAMPALCPHNVTDN